jgi:predicted ester cyclase
MDAIELVKSGLADIEAGRAEKFGARLADGFVFSGPVPKPIGKKEFLGMVSGLVGAIPDWKYNASEFKQEGDKVSAVLQITGTNTGELNLPFLRISKYPATGKRISLGRQPTTFTVKDGRVVRIDSLADPSVGVLGVLKSLGVPLPGA